MTARTAEQAAPALRRGWVRTVAVACLLLGSLLSFAGPSHAQELGAGDVSIVRISGEIDLGLAPFLDRVLREAEDAGAAAVVLDIDTPGGRLDAVIQMRDSLLAASVPTVAFVDRTALSAGALIALASDDIYFAPGGVMGAATPVDGTGITADEKVVSAVRSLFRSTAEQQGRDPVVAEAMVDPDVAVDDVIASGQLLTLTVSEAEAVGYADGVAADVPELLDQLGLADGEAVEAGISLAERLARIVTGSVVSSLLLAAGTLLIVGGLLSGGVTTSAIGVALLGTFLGGHLLAGLAGWEDVVLIAIGIGLLALEIFVIPGLGVAGAFGLAAILGGGFLATLNRDFDVVGTDQLLRSGLTIGVAFLLIVGGGVALMSFLTRRGGPDRLVLATALGEDSTPAQRSRGWLGWFDADAILASDREDDDHDASPVPAAPDGSTAREGEPSGPPADRAPSTPAHLPRPDARPGAVGVALTDLRPAGMAEIAGRRVDVVTEGEYLRAGDPIEVLVDEGWRRVVRRVRD
jgi:membrane-bound serine protease (ClpP class)